MDLFGGDEMKKKKQPVDDVAEPNQKNAADVEKSVGGSTGKGVLGQESWGQRFENIRSELSKLFSGGRTSQAAGSSGASGSFKKRY